MNWLSQAWGSCILLSRPPCLSVVAFAYQVSNSLLCCTFYKVDIRCQYVAYSRRGQIQLWQCSTSTDVMTAFGLFYTSHLEALHEAYSAATICRARFPTPFQVSWLHSVNQWSYTARKLVKYRSAPMPQKDFSSLVGEAILLTYVCQSDFIYAYYKYCFWLQGSSHTYVPFVKCSGNSFRNLF